MASWLVRVLDVRRPYPLGQADLRQRVTRELSRIRVYVETGPMTVFRTDGVRRTEWALQLRYDGRGDQDYLEDLISSTLARVQLQLVGVQPAPQKAVGKTRPAPSVESPTVPMVPRQRTPSAPAAPSRARRSARNSPYGMISAPTPYSGDTR